MGSTAAFGAEERLRQRTLEAAGPYAVPGDSAERLAAEARPTSAHPWRARLAVIAVLGVAVYSILSYWNVAAPVVPIWDGWFWIAQGKSLAEGGVSRLLHENHPLVYSDHMYLLPSVMALALGPIFDYSFRPLALLCVLSILGCAWTFYHSARTNGADRCGAVFVFLMVASFRHWENMLLGFQLGLPLCVALGGLAILVADRRRTHGGLAIAGLLAVCATLCSSGGFAAVIAIFLVRWFNPARPRWWIIVLLSGAIVVPALHYALLWMYDVSFIGTAFDKVTFANLPTTLHHTVRLLGGGVLSGPATVPVGLAILAGTCGMITAQLRRTGRVDALSGMAIWALFNAFAIASARMPFENPASRHEIFVAPAVGVCAIGLVRLIGHLGRSRAACYTALFSVFGWVHAGNFMDAVDYRWIVSNGDLDARFALVAMANGDTLTKAELARINPYPTEHVRGLLQYTIDRKWTIFAKGNTQFEVHRDLPTERFGNAAGEVVDGVLKFAGTGYVYNEYPCPYSQGCAVQISVDGQVEGTATVGVLALAPDGTESSNLVENMRGRGQVANTTVRGVVQPGTKIRPYVYSNGPADRVELRSYSVRILQATPGP